MVRRCRDVLSPFAARRSSWRHYSLAAAQARGSTYTLTPFSGLARPRMRFVTATGLRCAPTAVGAPFSNIFRGGPLVPNISLSFLNRRTINKQVCRVCHELAELKTERLCAVCAQIKAQIRSHFPDAVRRSMTTSAEQCKRSGCLCSTCGVRTLDPHPFYHPIQQGRIDERSIFTLDVTSCG
jgi:hypothetical protein